MQRIPLATIDKVESSTLYWKLSVAVSQPLSILLFTVCFLSAVVPAWAQSTDQANPTPLTTNELVINGPKKANQQYYYSFTAGSGEVTLNVSARAKSSSTFVGIKVFDAELNTVSYHNMSADTSPSMALKKFDVGEKQTLVLSFTSDSSLGECRIKFGGAVEFGAATEPTSPETSSDPTSSPPTETKPETETTPTTPEVSAAEGTASASKNKGFVFSILDAVGERFNIPANGKLRIEMKDGSVQEIDLAQVKKILVKK